MDGSRSPVVGRRGEDLVDSWIDRRTGSPSLALADVPNSDTPSGLRRVGAVPRVGRLVGFWPGSGRGWARRPRRNGCGVRRGDRGRARLRWFIDHRPHALVSVARVMSEVGAPAALVLVVVVAAVLLWRRGQRLLLALAPGIAFGLSGVGVAAGKLLVGRTRP